MTTSPRPPRPALASAPPASWRVTLALPDGGPPIVLRLMADISAEAVLTALELAGPGSSVRRVERQGEW